MEGCVYLHGVAQLFRASSPIAAQALHSQFTFVGLPAWGVHVTIMHPLAGKHGSTRVYALNKALAAMPAVFSCITLLIVCFHFEMTCCKAFNLFNPYICILLTKLQNIVY